MSKSKEEEKLKKKKLKEKEKKAKEKEKSKKSSKSKDKEKTKKKKKAKEIPEVKPVKHKLKATELFEHIAEKISTDKKPVDRKLVKAVIEALSDVIKGSVVKKGAGEFIFPKLFKIRVKDVPAKKARKGTNPFTGEEMMFKAKPASRKVKILPMKTLKETASPSE